MCLPYIDQSASGVDELAGWGMVDNGRVTSVGGPSGAPEEDSELLLAARVPIDDLSTEGALFTAKTEKRKAECVTLATITCKLKVAAATGDRELDFFVRAVQLLKSLIAAGEDRANSAEAWACQTFDKISKLQTLVEWLNWTIGRERLCVAEVFNAKLIFVRLVTTATLLARKCMISDAICVVRNSFPVEASSGAPGPSGEASADQA